MAGDVARDQATNANKQFETKEQCEEFYSDEKNFVFKYEQSEIKDCEKIEDAAQKKACQERQSKSETLGVVRLATAAGSAAGNAGSTVTSAMAAAKLDAASAKAAECATASAAVIAYRAQITAEDTASGIDMKLMTAANECSGFDTEILPSMKKLLTAAAVVAGVGAASGVAGTVLSVMNKDSYKATGDEYRETKSEFGGADIKAKATTSGGATAANILSGVSAAAGAGASVMSAISSNGSMKLRFNRLKNKTTACGNAIAAAAPFAAVSAPAAPSAAPVQAVVAPAAV
jgi:hypothetical protein